MKKLILDHSKDRYVHKQGKIIILSASSGAGKTTLLHAICDYFKDRQCLHRVITYTTRMARPGEVDGVDYHFISPEQFEQKKLNGFFLEWSEAYGASYGSPHSLLHDCKQGMSFIIVLDRMGVQRLRALCPEILVTVWLSVDIKNLEFRLKQRGSESLESYNHRLMLARQESEHEDGDGMFTYHVQNDDFSEALSRLISIITQELEII